MPGLRNANATGSAPSRAVKREDEVRKEGGVGEQARAVVRRPFGRRHLALLTAGGRAARASLHGAARTVVRGRRSAAQVPAA